MSVLSKKPLREPMLAKFGKIPENAVFELKYDGIRAMFSDGRLYNRNLVDITERFPEISVVTKRPVVLDGELVSFDENGVPDFQLIQRRANRIHLVDDLPEVVYVVFDVICENMPLCERRKILEDVVVTNSTCQIAPQFSSLEEISPLFSKGWEGAIAKDPKQLYLHGKRAWIKIKPTKRIVLPVIGYTPGTGKRKDFFGSLVTPKGLVGTGFDDETLFLLTKILRERTVSPGVVVPFNCEFEYAEITNDGNMRFPSFVRICEC